MPRSAFFATYFSSYSIVIYINIMNSNVGELQNLDGTTKRHQFFQLLHRNVFIYGHLNTLFIRAGLFVLFVFMRARKSLTQLAPEINQ